MLAGTKPLHFLRSVLPVMRRLLREQLDDAVSACSGADALLFTPLAIAGYHMAEKLGIPCCGASLQPVSLTRCFPSPVLTSGLSFGPYNQLSHVFVDHGYSELWRGEGNRWRRERLDLPPLPHGFTYSRFGGRELPMLYGFSPKVIPRPHDWSVRLYVTGYWFLDAPVD
jgi:sterol 3beta-glucosyltransferase